MREPLEPGKLMQRLREERLNQELTLEWVAAKVGVSTAAIGHFETGRASPTEETLRKWLKALGQPQEWADLWLDWQVEVEVAKVLEKLRGPRAVPPQDVEAIRRAIRNALAARR